MDTLTFISSALHTLVWPAVVVSLVVMLRKDIAVLFSRVSTLKHKETEVQFERELADAAAKAEEKHPSDPGYLSEPEAKKALAILEISPRAAVIAAWVDFEAAARGAVKEGDRPLTTRALVADLEKQRLIYRSDAEFLKTLQQVRNAALHRPEIEIDAETAFKVVTVLLRLSWEIRNGEKK